MTETEVERKNLTRVFFFSIKGNRYYNSVRERKRQTDRQTTRQTERQTGRGVKRSRKIDGQRHRK